MLTTTRVPGIVLILLLLPLLVVLGCAKRASSSGPSYYDEADYGYGGAPGGGGGYGDGGDYAEAEEYYSADDDMAGEMLSPEGANVSSRARATSKTMVDARSDFSRELAEPPAAPKPELKPTADPEAKDLEAPEQPRDAAPQAAKKRQIIYTATMQVSVYDVEHSVAVAESLPDRFGGWLHQRLDDQIVLRIPAEHLDAAMDAIAELGVVELRTLTGIDVTAQYTDLESRIRILTEMQAQLKELLTKAKTVEQALEIRKALDQITMELELARTRMRELAKSIAFSTLIVRFVARGPIVDLPTSNDPFPWVVELGVEATEYR